MSKLLTMLFITMLIACNNPGTDYSCKKGLIRVLNKERFPCVRGGGWCSFRLYLYDGKSANWYDTDCVTYNFYNINDTLPTIILTEFKKIPK